MNTRERARFDGLFEQVLEQLPGELHELIERTPVIVEDAPDPKMLAELDIDPDEDVLCGLHTGTPITERSVEHPVEYPEYIHLFREGILDTAGGWDDVEAVREQIRITLLHEIGHHYGLDEDALERYGYG